MIRSRAAAFIISATLATTAFAHAFDPFAEEKQAALTQLLESASTGDNDEALLQTESAIARFPKHAPFYALKAQFLLKAGRVAEARSASEQAVDLAPESALAHWMRGLIRHHQGEVAGALEDFDAAVKQEEDNEALRIQAMGSRGMALVDLARFQDALADLDRVIELRPNAFAERQFRATALLKLNRLDLAERDIKTLLEMDPTNSRSHRLQADLLKKRGKSEAAQAALNKAEQLANTDATHGARDSSVQERRQ